MGQSCCVESEHPAPHTRAPPTGMCTELPIDAHACAPSGQLEVPSSNALSLLTAPSYDSNLDYTDEPSLEDDEAGNTPTTVTASIVRVQASSNPLMSPSMPPSQVVVRRQLAAQLLDCNGGGGIGVAAPTTRLPHRVPSKTALQRGGYPIVVPTAPRRETAVVVDVPPSTACRQDDSVGVVAEGDTTALHRILGGTVGDDDDEHTSPFGTLLSLDWDGMCTVNHRTTLNNLN